MYVGRCWSIAGLATHETLQEQGNVVLRYEFDRKRLIPCTFNLVLFTHFSDDNYSARAPRKKQGGLLVAGVGRLSDGQYLTYQELAALYVMAEPGLTC